MQLWTAHLTSLRGFYASDAYVVAENRHSAAWRVLQGVQTYLDREIEESGYVALVDGDPDDPDWSDRARMFLVEIYQEALENLELVPGSVIIKIRN